VGRAFYTGHHLAPAPDRKGAARQAIVFELALESEAGPSVPAGNPQTSERSERGQVLEDVLSGAPRRGNHDYVAWSLTRGTW
jgi:hypothetical protein